MSRWYPSFGTTSNPDMAILQVEYSARYLTPMTQVLSLLKLLIETFYRTTFRSHNPPAKNPYFGDEPVFPDHLALSRASTSRLIPCTVGRWHPLLGRLRVEISAWLLCPSILSFDIPGALFGAASGVGAPGTVPAKRVPYLRTFARDTLLSSSTCASQSFV